MMMKIVKKSETPLLSRTRVTAEFEEAKATPSKTDVLKHLAKDLNVPEEVISLRHIYTKFGKTNGKVIAHVYASKKDLEKIEVTPRKLRKANAEAKKKALEEHKAKKAGASGEAKAGE